MTGRDGRGGPVTQPVCDPAELRGLFLFAKLTDEQLTELCHIGHIEAHQPGPVYQEGDPARWFYVLIEGAVVTSRKVGDDDIEVNRTDQAGVYGGAFQAYLGDRLPQLYANSMRVTQTSRFYVMSADDFARIMNEWFPMAVHMLEGLFFGGRATQQAVEQRERLLALGSLSAGLTHELNNPAAAAVRATAALRERVAGMRSKLALLTKGAELAHGPGLAHGPVHRADLQDIIHLQQRAVEQVGKAPKLDPLATSDAEDEVADWLADHDIGEGWQIATAFVLAGLGTEWLDEVRDTVTPATLEPALRWIHYALSTELLMNEIEDAVTRISTLVGAARQYSQLDRAPYSETDVHDLLDSTIMMLSGKISPDVRIVKDYDRSIPKIPCFAAELNQVWTNIIDNAVSAMDGRGTLTVRTAREDDRALIEFGDTGPGIPADIRDRIFEPFFTTKPVGEGTGLGLDISYRIVVNKHHGDLRVESVPGDTRFQVRLPLQAPDRAPGAGPDATGPRAVIPPPAGPTARQEQA
ncbi:MAG TPA: ATP-binding protein [Trebonia sp.]|nr:ATP-binding protein [Trebonia sp.]